jgi:hypothetical protein
MFAPINIDMDSKSLLAILLLLSIMISLLGSWAAISSLSSFAPVPVSQQPQGGTGKVSVFVEPPDADYEKKGEVKVFLE